MRNSGILAFLGGAIAGAAVALLLAPRKGEQTRQMIKDYVDNEVKRCKCHHHHDHDHDENPYDHQEHTIDQTEKI